MTIGRILTDARLAGSCRLSPVSYSLMTRNPYQPSGGRQGPAGRQLTHYDMGEAWLARRRAPKAWREKAACDEGAHKECLSTFVRKAADALRG